MTAEIAVLNKRAVALAADSAVTITIENHARFYNTENKLFMLSKYEPVGIMIYNNAEFMGVPWETLIKEYREYIGRKSFKHLEDYAEEFFKFLYKNERIFTPYEEEYFKIAVISLFQEIKKVFEDKYGQKAEEIKGKPDLKDITILINQAIDECYKEIMARENLEGNTEEIVEKIKNKYEGLLDSLVNNDEILSFGENLDKLKESCYNIFIKNCSGVFDSGLVFAGFGSEDIFPVLISYNISGFIVGYLKKKLKRTKKIDHEYDFVIIPFAQSDMVHTFLRGINPRYIATLNHYYHNLVLNKIEEIDDNIFEGDKAKLKAYLKSLWDQVIQGIYEYSNEEYLEPILKVIPVLPIEEMALLAESLVNLTSLRRQMAFDENLYTVGGPIDVAVISKGDGFIWIKRKHYFKPELNHHFFNNYYLK